MASASSGEDTIQRVPLKTIGAQDLISSSKCSKTGLLRKQCALQRSFKFLKWPTKFVIVSCGCIYLYKDEYSRSPTTALPLSLYSRAVRLDDQGRIHWAFNLVPFDGRTGKVLIFACTSDTERKDWMHAMKDEMYKANGMEKPFAEVGLDEYVSLEREIIPMQKQTVCGIEDDYSRIDEAGMSRPPMPGPQATLERPKKPSFKPADPPRYAEPTKAKKQDRKSEHSIQKTKLPTPPSTPTTEVHEISPSALSRTSFEYSGSDRKDVESILMPLPDGTFLVRKSRNDEREVLSVAINGVLKEYKIYYKQGQYTIDHQTYFSTTEGLLANYHQHDLPKKNMKLFRAYSLTDTGYINVN